MKLGYSQEALGELESIATYYTAESAALAERFRADLHRAEDLLRRDPRAGHVVVDDYRRLLMNAFPFGLIYRFHENHRSIEIIAVAHQHRRPGYWVNRIHEERAVYRSAA